MSGWIFVLCLCRTLEVRRRRAGLRIGTEGLSPSPPPTCSVLAGGVRVHRASSNDATLPKPTRPRKRKVRVGRKIFAALSPGGRVLPAANRQGSCPTPHHRSRHLHLADYGTKPAGSNRTLSRLAVTQGRGESKALGDSTQPARNQSLASQIVDKGIWDTGIRGKHCDLHSLVPIPLSFFFRPNA